MIRFISFFECYRASFLAAAFIFFHHVPDQLLFVKMICNLRFGKVFAVLSIVDFFFDLIFDCFLVLSQQANGNNGDLNHITAIGLVTISMIG